MSLPAPVVFALCHNASTHVCMCTHVPIDNIRTAQSPYILFQVESKGSLAHIITAKEEHFSQQMQLYVTIIITLKSNEQQKTFE